MKFKAGDVCVVVDNPASGGRLVNFTVGDEVTIEGIDLFRRHLGCENKPIYIVGNELFICECSLRLKRPPDREQIVEWADCIWKPTGVSA